MVAGIGEALVGYRVDPDAGPLVMVAAGGILTEIYRDRSLRLAPVDLAIAKEMIGEVRAFKALAGFRGVASLGYRPTVGGTEMYPVQTTPNVSGGRPRHRSVICARAGTAS